MADEAVKGTYPYSIPQAQTTPIPGVLLATLPNEGGEWSVERVDLEEFASQPRRATSDQTVIYLESFASIVNRYKRAGTVIEASASGTMLATIDHHEPSADGAPGNPGWRDHTIALKRPKTNAYATWQKATAGAALTQRAFAELIEERIGDIAAPAGGDLLDIVSRFRASKSITFEAEQNLGNGSASVTYVEKVDDGDATRPGGVIKMPTELTLAIKVYRDDPEPTAMIVRVRWNLHDKAVQFTLKMADSVIDAIDALHDAAVLKVAADCGVPVYRTE